MRLALTTPNLLPTDNGVRTLEHGRHIVRIDSFESDGTSMDADLMIWFSGDLANLAAEVDGRQDVPVPNDYHIRNADPTLLRIPIDPGVAITSAWWQYEATNDLSNKPMTLDELLSVFADPPDNAASNMIHDPWWVTVEDGVVVQLDEQYIP